MQLRQIVASLFFIIQGEDLPGVTHLSASDLHVYINYFLCRASPSEFVIPLAKYVKAVYHTRVSVGMRFRMLFETEESSVRR